MKEIIPHEKIESRIYLVRDKKVMLDRDLAELYGVDTKQLKRQVRRNIGRFPSDFMIELTKEETESLRSQIGTLKRGEHSKYLPYAFTEQGVAMLSSVLNSERAIQVNIQIMRAFMNLRHMALSYKEIWKKIEGMEKKYDESFKVVFDTLKSILLAGPEKLKKKIGFEK